MAQQWKSVDEQFPQYRYGTGAEDSGERYVNDAYTQFKNLELGYWTQFLPQLGFTGPLTKELVEGAGTLNESTTTTISDEAKAAIDSLKAQGYDVVVNPSKIDFGKKGVTEFGFKTPDGKVENTWEYTGGAWYEQMAPYLGLVLPAVLGVAGTKLGVAGTGAGGAVTVGDVAKSIGANITGQTGNALLNNVVGGAVIGGAKELIATGGDADAAIRGALSAGALAGVAEIAQPYIEKAANALSNLTSEEVSHLASTDVAGDVGLGELGGDVGQVEVGGAGIDARIYQTLSPSAKEIYEIALTQGVDPSVALTRAAAADARFAAGGYTGLADTSINALAGGAAAGAAGTAGAATGATGATNALAGGDVVSTQVTPTARIPTVVTDALPERPLAGTTGAGTTGLGTAAAGAGALGAGALGAETAGAVGTVGGGLTVPPGAGLGEAGAITTPGGLDATVAGGTGITAGTTGGAGLDTSGLALGGALGAGAAAGSALPVGSAAAAGSAITPAAGLTGIKAVDDFLSYLGTPAGAMALSAFGGLAGGYFQGEAAKEAAQIQANAAEKALKLQEDMFEYQKSLLAPYQEVGVNALRRLEGVMGLGGQPATGGQQLLEMDPGYAFRLGEGMKALERLQAARGNMLSGGAIKAGQRYAQDVASQEYGSAFNRLARIAGIGQETGTQLGAAGQQFGQTASGAMGDVANAMAAGRIQRTGAYTGAISDVSKAYSDFYNQQQRNQLIRDIYGRVGG
jgi:hypothetical protein